MLLTSPAGRSHLLDFFVAAPGRGLENPDPAPLVPVEVAFSPETIQIFNVGASSCGAYGNPAGLAYALERYGTLGLGDLTPAAAKAAREGVEVTPIQEYLLRILGPIFRSTPEGTALYEPDGHPVVAGERLPMPELADLLDRLGAEGPGFLYDGDVAAACSEWVLERGGLLTRAGPGRLRGDRARARRRRLPRPAGADQPAAVVGRDPDRRRAGAAGPDRPAGRHRDAWPRSSPPPTARATTSSCEGLRSTDYVQQFLAPGALDRVAGEIGSRLGSTTHISVMDADGGCATVTCSNGSSSGIVVPGTGMHLNNMMGEEDLNPGGFHEHPPGARVPSMMAPTVVLRDGRPEIALGSAGSNRIRSAIVQTIAAVVDGGMAAQAAVDSPAGARGGAAGGRRAGGGRGRPGRAAGARLAGQALAGAQPVLRRRAGRGARCRRPRSPAGAIPAAAAWPSRSTSGRSSRRESLTAGPMTFGRPRGNLCSCPST